MQKYSANKTKPAVVQARPVRNATLDLDSLPRSKPAPKAKPAAVAKAKPAPKPRAEGASGSFFDNLRLTPKIALIVGALMLGTGAIVFTAFQGLQTMKYHVGNLYEFMLIPIQALSKADAEIADANGETVELRNLTLAADERKDIVTDMKADWQEAEETVERYNKEWVTTASAEFTATLQGFGKLDLQQQEVASLGKLNALVGQVNASLKQLEASQGSNLNEAATVSKHFKGVRTELATLIKINDEFAKLSADDATSAQSRALLGMWIALGVSLAAGLGLTYLVSRSVTGRLGQLEQDAAALQEGKLDIKIDVQGQDEVGAVAQALAVSVNQLRAKADEDARKIEENRAFQNNVSEFLMVATEIAQGDLTRRGQVTQDVLGNVVDAINVVTEEIGYILKDVRNVADRVNEGADSLTSTSKMVLEGAQAQAQDANRARIQALSVTESIRQMAEEAGQTARAAQQTLSASQSGQLAVQDTRSGLENIRSQMQGLAEGIQGLSTRSSEIQDIVKTISGFASQTNLLALGASLEAAGAGAAGQRFMAVAEGVRKLAEDSAAATQRVAALVKSVQSEIQGLVDRAEAGARDVENGYMIAEQAGQRLQEIASLATQSARVAQSISTVAQQQVNGVEQVTQAVLEISGTAGKTEGASLEGRQAAEELRTLAKQLSDGLSRFTLPA